MLKITMSKQSGSRNDLQKPTSLLFWSTETKQDLWSWSLNEPLKGRGGIPLGRRALQHHSAPSHFSTAPHFRERSIYWSCGALLNLLNGLLCLKDQQRLWISFILSHVSNSAGEAKVFILIAPHFFFPLLFQMFELGGEEARVTNLSWFSQDIWVLALKVQRLGNSLSLGKTGAVDHPTPYFILQTSCILNLNFYCGSL